MNNETYFRDLFASIENNRKIVLLLFLIKFDVDLLREVWFLENDFNRLSSEFKTILLEQNEKNHNHCVNFE